MDNTVTIRPGQLWQMNPNFKAVGFLKNEFLLILRETERPKDMVGQEGRRWWRVLDPTGEPTTKSERWLMVYYRLFSEVIDNAH